MQRRKIIVFLVGLALIVLGVCMAYHWAESEKIRCAYAVLPVETLTIKNHKFQVKIANTLQAAMQGLSGQRSLADDQGMYFIFPQQQQSVFWMKDMHFAIDILWVRQNTIVGIDAQLPPPERWNFFAPLLLYPSPGLVNKVLEIKGGLAEKLGIRVGDRVAQ